jgi:hypothetical protein
LEIEKLVRARMLPVGPTGQAAKEAKEGMPSIEAAVDISPADTQKKETGPEVIGIDDLF